jgi:penicillin-insensitive murein endopeptidase
MNVRLLSALPRVLLATMLSCAVAAPSADAQETAAQEAARRDSALSSLPRDAARRLFGAVASPAPGEARIVGEYWKGCYTGGAQLPAVGEHWQAMRLSRHRNWGTPRLISFLERFAGKAAEATGWPGILVGDLSQPVGGPMLTGHSSHQLGIEADIWLRPMPNRRWSPEENENVLSTDLVRADRKDVDPKRYTPQHLALLRAAAREPEVARVFVNAAIKKALCRDAGSDRSWLRKIRPAAGHTYHFHIRLACPQGQADCIDQAPPEAGDGCGKELDYWFSAGVLHPKAGGSDKPLSVAAMPPTCRDLVRVPTAKR